MRIYTDQLGKRLAGVFLGLGFIGVGAYSVIGGIGHTDAFIQDRALWFGITALIAGIGAAVVSLTVGKIDNIWCSPPRRWFR